jgi:hypothetical protein
MRKVPESRVREVLAMIPIAAPPEVVLAAACDSDTYKDSDKYLENYRYYATSEPNIWYAYYVVKVPLIARRDYTLRYERTEDKDKQIFKLSWKASTKLAPPPSEDIVRVNLLNGQIEIKPRNGGNASIMTYYVLADPGGKLPVWLINLANKVSLPTILREIRDAALRKTEHGSHLQLNPHGRQ